MKNLILAALVALPVLMMAHDPTDYIRVQMEDSGFFDRGVIHEPTEERLKFLNEDLEQLQGNIQEQHRGDKKIRTEVPPEVDAWFFEG